MKNKFYIHTGHEYAFLYSENPATGPYSKPINTVYIFTIFITDFEIHFTIIFPSMLFHPSCLFPRVLTNKILYTRLVPCKLQVTNNRNMVITVF